MDVLTGSGRGRGTRSVGGPGCDGSGESASDSVRRRPSCDSPDRPSTVSPDFSSGLTRHPSRRTRGGVLPLPPITSLPPSLGVLRLDVHPSGTRFFSVHPPSRSVVGPCVWDSSCRTVEPGPCGSSSHCCRPVLSVSVVPRLQPDTGRPCLVVGNRG